MSVTMSLADSPSSRSVATHTSLHTPLTGDQQFSHGLATFDLFTAERLFGLSPFLAVGVILPVRPAPR